MTATETKLIEVLTRGLKLQRQEPVTPATAIFGKAGPGRDGLGLDSVDVLEVAVLVDKHFGVMLEEANDQVRGALANIGALAAFIDGQSGKKT
jgi:acyl carrier protein